MINKDKIIINKYYYDDDNGNTRYDFDSIREEFEADLKEMEEEE